MPQEPSSAKMDRISIASTTARIAGMCTTLSQAVGRYRIETKNASAAVCEFHRTICALQCSVVEVSNLLRQRVPEALPFEREHYEHVENIVGSCLCTLEMLATQLRSEQWQQEGKAEFDMARVNFDLALGSNPVKQLTSHIKSYNHVLQLSKTTLSLAAMRPAQGNQDEIRDMIQQLADFMPRLRLTRLSMELGSPFLMGMSENVAEANTSIGFDIQAWRVSAEKVAAAASSYGSDRMPRVDFDSNICTSSKASLLGTITDNSGADIAFDCKHEDNSFFEDSEPRHGKNDDACPHVLRSLFEQNRKTVAQLVSSGIFAEASRLQRKCIDYKMSLAILGEVPFPGVEQADMHEHLAEILLKTGTRDSETEAIEIFEKLLADEVRQPARPLDQNRIFRLYHRLGSIYMLSSPGQHDQSERLKLAKTLLKRAFDGRREIEPMPRDLVLESGDLLVRVMHLDGDFESAREYMEWMRRELRPDMSTPSSYKKPWRRLQNQRRGSQAIRVAAEDIQGDEEDSEEVVNAYMWSQTKGFDIDAVNFAFEACSAFRGTSPLHLAVFEENMDIIRPMLEGAVSLEHRDCDDQTPLLLACRTRNHKVVGMLLESGSCLVDVDGLIVCDHRGKSALHLCQDKKGGVRVAKLLMQYAQRLASPLSSNGLAVATSSRPEVQLLNAADHTGKTAVSVAAENGNEEMVQFLLEAGACPNISDNHGKTALYVACERGDERVVRQLLLPKNGPPADPNAPGPGLCTLLMAVLENVPSIASRMAITRMLLEAGADPHLADGDGRTAAMVAKQSSFSSQLVRMMEEAVAPVDRVESSLCSKGNSYDEKLSNNRLAWNECRHQGQSRIFG